MTKRIRFADRFPAFLARDFGERLGERPSSVVMHLRSWQPCHVTGPTNSKKPVSLHPVPHPKEAVGRHGCDRRTAHRQYPTGPPAGGGVLPALLVEEGRGVRNKAAHPAIGCCPALYASNDLRCIAFEPAAFPNEPARRFGDLVRIGLPGAASPPKDARVRGPGFRSAQAGLLPRILKSSARKRKRGTNRRPVPYPSCEALTADTRSGRSRSARADATTC
jgi:hypothetical protein